MSGMRSLTRREAEQGDTGGLSDLMVSLDSNKAVPHNRTASKAYDSDDYRAPMSRTTTPPRVVTRAATPIAFAQQATINANGISTIADAACRTRWTSNATPPARSFIANTKRRNRSADDALRSEGRSLAATYATAPSLSP